MSSLPKESLHSFAGSKRIIGNTSPVKTLSKRISKESAGKRATAREICDKIIAKQ
jgi:hypothetical protein